MMGNKGGAAIRFKLMDSTICFVCSHLAAHRENVAVVMLISISKKKRMKRSCNRICDNIHFKHNEEDEEGFGILDHDLIFWVSEYILHII